MIELLKKRDRTKRLGLVWERDEIEAEMEAMRVESEELRAGQAALAAELERKFIEQNTKLKKDYERKLEDMKRSAEEDIDERLDASVKRILQQNRRMAEELRLHVQESEQLEREKGGRPNRR
jgi:hypothetical protein